jgi:hypothetical protein
MKKKYIVFMFAFVALAIILILVATTEPKCKSQDHFNGMTFYGAVTDKCLDNEQHGIPILVLVDLNEKVEIKIDFFLEKTNTYESININDILYKPKNSDSLYIFKNNVKTFMQKVQFECTN